MSEDVEAFRARARSWIRANLPPLPAGTVARHVINTGDDEAELALIARERELQRLMYDGGLAGICVPVEYGGQGLTVDHQHALNEELAGFEYPMRLQVPTMTPCLALILEFGTEEQKLRHIPPILRGEALWMQFLSEPSGGSDVAGALTTALRDGEEWILNGSKVWTTGAWWSDWALCLARTNWEIPKHRGLTVFMLPIHQPGIEVHRIEMLNGSREFCQEFMTDVRVPDAERLGEVDDGWTVGTRWMFHERLLHNSPYVTDAVGTVQGAPGSTSVMTAARANGRIDDPWARDLVGAARTLEIVGDELQRRVGEGIRSGRMSDQSSAIARLFKGHTATRISTLRFEAAGAIGVAWADADGFAGCGNEFLMRQAAAIAGGTTEMARQVISERVLGMPRERTGDRDVAFREVPRSRPNQGGPNQGRPPEG